MEYANQLGKPLEGGQHKHQKPDDCFKLFPALPYEIRALVWDFSFPPGTVTVVCDEKTDYIKFACIRNPESSYIQLACIEARKVWLLHHREFRIREPASEDLALSSAWTVRTRAVRIDLAKGLLYFGQDRITRVSIAASVDGCAEYLAPDNSEDNSPRRIHAHDKTRLAVSQHSFSDLPAVLEFLRNGAMRFPNVQTIILIDPLYRGFGHTIQRYTIQGYAGDCDAVPKDSGLLNMAARLAYAPHEGSENFLSVVSEMAAPGPDEERFLRESLRPQIKRLVQPAEEWENGLTFKAWGERSVLQNILTAAEGLNEYCSVTWTACTGHGSFLNWYQFGAMHNNTFQYPESITEN